METTIYKCFIASPGDTQKERELCDEIFREINGGLGRILNCRVESLKWEKDVRPSFGEDGQQVINSQIGKEYDLFIGIMYKKFGTPTLHAGSGTEEEFNIAYERYIKKDNVDIMFYFNSERTLLTDINLAQLEKVNKFKDKVGGLGGLYCSFEGAEDFATKLRSHITKFLGERHTASSGITVRKVSADSIETETLKRLFSKRWNDALRVFEGQPNIWIEPILSSSKDIARDPNENFINRVSISKLIDSPESTIISAPPQFGLTCLAHYLVKEAWEKGDLWIYLDSHQTKPHTIHNAVKNAAEELEQKPEDVKCIILDSWFNYENNALKKIKNLCDAHKSIPIIVMQKIDDCKFINSEEEESITIEREFKSLHLLALPRTQIRKLISEYNKVKSLGDEDILVSKVTQDLDVLNIHRTPFNCFTLLKAAEKQFDESPVNRTKMIEQVLYVLFDLGRLPTYKTQPDVKDCEFVLGRYCESIIKDSAFEFSRDSFLKDLEKYCKEKLIDLEVSIVFDVLINNGIIIKKGPNFSFRNTFWIFYFAAKRMHTSPEFAKYVFDSKIYISFPEIIEFYTGIDRNREDALQILTRDIKETCDIVFEKVGMPDNVNPYAHDLWRPNEESIKKVQEEISQNVLKSNLPEEVKDQYADKSYNQIRPYNQSIRTIFAKYSLHNLIQNIRASSRALRNSDYVDPVHKRALLLEIMRSWEQLSKVLLALAPMLAAQGKAAFEGQTFNLLGDFGETFEERLNTIIQVTPTNIIGLYKDDFYSPKLGPLLFEQFNAEPNPLKKHHLALLIIFGRPNDWKKIIESYIESLNKNSFFLYDTVNAIKAKYSFDFVSKETEAEMVFLIKLGLAKHEFGGAKPVHRIKEILNSNLPKRESLEEKP